MAKLKGKKKAQAVARNVAIANESALVEQARRLVAQAETVPLAFRDWGLDAWAFGQNWPVPKEKINEVADVLKSAIPNHDTNAGKQRVYRYKWYTVLLPYFRKQDFEAEGLLDPSSFECSSGLFWAHFIKCAKEVLDAGVPPEHRAGKVRAAIFEKLAAGKQRAAERKSTPKLGDVGRLLEELKAARRALAKMKARGAVEARERLDRMIAALEAEASSVDK